MNQLNILILEDEFIIAERLERLLTEIITDYDVRVDVTHALEDAQAFLDSHVVDLLFLDLNINEQDGFSLLEQVASERFQTIIVSAYEDKAITAFEYGVLDFIPKPFDKERVEKAFARFHEARSDEIKIKYLVVKLHGRLRTIPLVDIYMIKADGNYSELHLSKGQKYLHSKSLNDLMKQLPPSFERVHKSYAIQLNMVDHWGVKGGGRYNVHLKNDQVIPVGRSYYQSIKSRLLSDFNPST